MRERERERERERGRDGERERKGGGGEIVYNPATHMQDMLAYNHTNGHKALAEPAKLEMEL